MLILLNLKTNRVGSRLLLFCLSVVVTANSTTLGNTITNPLCEWYPEVLLVHVFLILLEICSILSGGS